MRTLGIFCLLQLGLYALMGGNLADYYGRSLREEGWSDWASAGMSWVLLVIFNDIATFLIGALNAMSSTVATAALLAKIATAWIAFGRPSQQRMEIAVWFVGAQFAMSMYVMWIEPFFGSGGAANEVLQSGFIEAFAQPRAPINYIGKLPLTAVMAMACFYWIGVAKEVAKRST